MTAVKSSIITDLAAFLQTAKFQCKEGLELCTDELLSSNCHSLAFWMAVPRNTVS